MATIGTNAGLIIINWQALGVGVAFLTLILAFIMWRQRTLKNEITSAVNSLKDVLLEKLETKDRVNELKVEMTRIATVVDEILRGKNA